MKNRIRARSGILCYFFMLCLLSGFTWPRHGHLRNGYWRCVLQRPDGHEIVFNMLTKDSAGRQLMYVVNASERLQIDRITYAGDSVLIQMPFFESGFRARVDADGNLTGIWTKKLKDRDQVMPFQAYFSQKQRFETANTPVADISGRWAASFGTGNNKDVAVGEFKQNGQRVTGTFLTPTGDYRFLEGVVDGDSLRLSCFDGGHAFLFTAKILNGNELSGGKFYSGAKGIDEWSAKKDPNAQLPDGFDQAHLRPGESSLNFRFNDLNGRPVSIKDARYKNKVVVIQIMGSWCPNCMDETNFLSQYYRQNHKRGVEVLALAYERSTNLARSRASLQRFQKHFDVRYPILITGVTLDDPQMTEKTLPQIDQVKGFPTSIFIDKKGNVRKIYTGFEGPGTGAHYAEFQREFEKTIDTLLSE